MTLHLLGTGDAFGSGGRLQTCFWLEADGYRALVDCGATSGLALRQLDAPVDPDAVLLTHFHGDHYGGLPFLLIDQHFVRRRERPLEVFGPPGVRKRVKRLFEMLYPGVTLGFEVQYGAYPPNAGALAVGPWQVRAWPVAHAPETLPHGLRVETTARTVAFSGDTGWADVLPALSRDADVFVCECNFFDTRTDTHLDLQTLRTHRDELTARRVVLHHFDREMLARLNEVDDFETGYDGQVIS